MRGPVHGIRGITTGTLSPPDISGYRVKAMTKGVTPHSDAGSRKGDVKGMYFASAPAGISGFRIKCGMTKTGIPGSRIEVRDDQMTVSGAMTKTRSPVRPMGESGRKNGGEGRMKGKDV